MWDRWCKRKRKVGSALVKKRLIWRASNLALAVALGLGLSAQSAWAAFPDSYDLRDEGRVTAIRNQGLYGTCWTFGAMASLESNYLTQLQKAGVSYHLEEIDFSERNLAWLTYAKPVDAPDYPMPQVEMEDQTNQFDVEHFEGQVFQQGGQGTFLIGMLARGDGLIWEKYAPYEYTREHPMQGVQTPQENTAAGILKNAYGSFDNMIDLDGTQEEIDAQIERYKELIREHGALNVSYFALDSRRQDIYSPAPDEPNHAISLIGWDDAYQLRDANGELLRDANGDALRPGAWILRNSWGQQAGDKGYYHISYYEPSLDDPFSLTVETDAKRYTRNDQHALLGINDAIEIDGNQAAFAGRYTAAAPQFIKAVGFYTSEDNASYKIEILTDAHHPEDGKVVYAEEGQFTGSERFSGYHTVDLENYVFLPQGKDYIARITVTLPDGTEHTEIAINSKEKRFSSLKVQPGWSFVLKEDGWWDAYQFVDDEGNAAPATVFMRSLAKDTDQANGGDFTVKYLNNDGLSDGSRINLGKKDELYGSDPLRPDRRTLSNMTVDLTYGETDSVYGGEIFGEGGVIKTGTGFLNLTGANTYTGGSYVNQGVLQIDGSVASGVWSQQSGVVSGKGRIGGTLVNHAVVQPGSYGGLETLTVDGDFISDGKIAVAVQGEQNSSLNVGGKAEIEGSAFLPVAGSSYQADRSYPFLTADGGVTGSFQSSAFSGMMSAVGTVEGTAAQMKLVRQNNMGALNTRQERVYTAVGNMYEQLGGDARQRGMDALYNLDAAQARAAMTELHGGLQADLAGYVQRRDFQGDAVAARLAGNLGTAAFAGDTAAYAGAVPFEAGADQGWWINLKKGWDSIDSDASFGKLNAHSFGIALGTDKKVGSDWRIGTVFTYENATMGTSLGEGENDDYRLGVYGGYSKGPWDTALHLAYGWQKNDVKRFMPTLGLSTDSDYDGNTLEFGIQARYDAQREKKEKVVPYAKMNVVRYSQDAYKESGAGLYDQQADQMDNTYSTAELGLVYEKTSKKGEFAFNLGYKRVLNGENPRMRVNFAGDQAYSFAVEGNAADQEFLVVGVRGESRLTDQLALVGKIESEIGSKTRSTSAAALLQYEW